MVLPLVPVMVIQGAAPDWARIRHASSTSPQTGMPRAAAASSSGWSGRKPGEVTTSSMPSGTSSGVLGAQPDVDVQDLQDPGAFADGFGGVGADGGDDGAAVRERVGGREPADAEAGDQDPQRRPVGVAVGEVASAPAGLVAGIGVVSAHDRGLIAAPTTHSA